MTRTKKKSSSPEPSVVQAAWDAFYKKREVDDLETLRAEGWKTIDQIAQETGRSRNTIDHATRNAPAMERRAFHVVSANGTVRKMNLVRPKLKG